MLQYLQHSSSWTDLVVAYNLIYRAIPPLSAMALTWIVQPGCPAHLRPALECAIDAVPFELLAALCGAEAESNQSGGAASQFLSRKSRARKGMG